MNHCDILRIVPKNPGSDRVPELLRLYGLLRFRRLCEQHGVAVRTVPGDNNCMVWALRMLVMGQEFCDKASQSQSVRQQRKLRKALGDMWVERRFEETWQVIFEETCQEVLEPVPKTPPKKPGVPLTGDVDLVTPPRPEPPEEKRRCIQRIGECQPVKFQGPANPVELKLKPPEPAKAKSAKQDLLEPEVPNVEEVFHENLQIAKAPCDPPSATDPVLSESEESGGQRKKKKVRNHARTCRTKVVSERQAQMQRLTTLLANKGVTYLGHRTTHQQRCLIKKAAVCEVGGFVKLKETLFAGKWPSCEVCKFVLEKRGVDLEGVKAAIKGEDVDVFKQHAAGAESEQHQTEQIVGDDADDLSAQERERRRCEKYVQSFAPIISLENSHSDRWKFRCSACRTSKQPRGRSNVLGCPKLARFKHFLTQHLNSASHRSNMLKYGLEMKTASAEKSGENVAGEEGEEDLKILEPDRPCQCQGYIVSSSLSPGTLHLYIEEFQLWATHSKLSSKLGKHGYSCSFRDNVWYLKHSDCKSTSEVPYMLGEVPQTCKLCSRLGSPREVQRRVLRFAGKYYGALLLNKKLFAPEEETAEYINSTSETTFGKRCALWGTLLKLSLPELQQCVRKQFATLHSDETTPQLLSFIDWVVEPCKRVHVASIDEKYKTLFAKFSNALSSEHLTESRHISYMWFTPIASNFFKLQTCDFLLHPVDIGEIQNFNNISYYSYLFILMGFAKPAMLPGTRS